MRSTHLNTNSGPMRSAHMQSRQTVLPNADFLAKMRFGPSAVWPNAAMTARVSSNVRVQDVDLFRSNVLDNRRLKIVSDGLVLFVCAQLVGDTSLVSVLRRGAVDGASLVASPSAHGCHLLRTDRTQREDKACRPRLRGGRALI